jgi:hypothetical protein
MHMGAARSSLYEYAVPSACTCRRTSMAVGCLPGSSLEESVGIRRKVVGRLWDAELTLWSTIIYYPLAASQPVSPRSSWLSCPLTRNPPDGGRVWGFGQTLFQTSLKRTFSGHVQIFQGAYLFYAADPTYRTSLHCTTVGVLGTF